jgi:uncharacterized membrane protein SirB2
VEHYTLVKTIHVGSVVLSGCFFLLRGIWMIRSSASLQQRWVRIIPHVIDTVLLLSAVWLAVITQQYPWQQPWLGAKIVALLFYIALGMLAIRYGRTRRIRIGSFIGALLVFAYIVGVALSRQMLPFVE